MGEYLVRIVKIKGSNVLPMGSFSVDVVDIKGILKRMDKGDVITIERLTDKIWRE